MTIKQKNISVKEKYQKELIKELCNVIDDYFCGIGGYYYKIIDNLKEDIKKAIYKNI